MVKFQIFDFSQKAETSCLKMQTLDNVCLHIFPKFLFILSEAISNFIFYSLNFFKMLIIFIVVTNKSPKVYNNKKKTAKWQILLLGKEGEGKENKRNF